MFVFNLYQNVSRFLECLLKLESLVYNLWITGESYNSTKLLNLLRFWAIAISAVFSIDIFYLVLTLWSASNVRLPISTFTVRRPKGSLLWFLPAAAWITMVTVAMEMKNSCRLDFIWTIGVFFRWKKRRLYRIEFWDRFWYFFVFWSYLNIIVYVYFL